MTATRTQVPGAANRARVSNGTVLLATGDNRTVWYRRFRDLIGAHLNDLGGAESVSEAERSIVRRISTLTCELESLESLFSAQGSATERQLDLYSRVSSTVRRLLESIGIRTRKPRPIGVVELMDAGEE